MKKIDYTLTQDFIELNHLLKLTGFADSGGSGGALVTTGVVKVDGQVELRKRNKIRAGQVVQIADSEIHVVANPDGVVAPQPKAAKVANVANVAKARAGGKPTPKGVAQRRRPRGVAPTGVKAGGRTLSGAKPAKPRNFSK